ncbi:MAG: LysR family transcriptional regulator [Pseudomonadota bacterium]
MPDRLTHLATFLRVAERGSLTAAARDLSVSQPTVTRAIAALERALGTTLFHRTTHSLSLTEPGRSLVPKARRMLSAWDALAEELAEDDALTGPLHVVAPIALGQTALIPVMAAFRTDHPGVTVNWQLTDEVVRLSETGADLWIRVGDVPDDTLVQRRLGHVTRHVFGAPIFEKRPLRACPWITVGPYEGRQIALEGRTFEVAPVLNTNSIAVAARALVDGVGVAIAPDWYMRDDLEAGRVVRLGPPAAVLPVHLAFASDRRSRRLDAFMAAVTDRLKIDVLD